MSNRRRKVPLSARAQKRERVRLFTSAEQGFEVDEDGEDVLLTCFHGYATFQLRLPRGGALTLADMIKTAAVGRGEKKADVMLGSGIVVAQNLPGQNG